MQKFDNKVKLLITAYGGLVKAVNTHQLKLPPNGDTLPDWVRKCVDSLIYHIPIGIYHITSRKWDPIVY